MSQQPHPVLGVWQQDDDGNAVMEYLGRRLAIKWNNVRGMYDGFIDGKDVDMHSLGTAQGLVGLTGMLQREARKRYEAETFKYKQGQRVECAWCVDNQLRSNGIIEHVRYVPEAGDREPAYLINFGDGLCQANESEIRLGE
jgi:hypothetical protein